MKEQPTLAFEYDVQRPPDFVDEDSIPLVSKWAFVKSRIEGVETYMLFYPEDNHLILDEHTILQEMHKLAPYSVFSGAVNAQIHLLGDGDV